MINEVAVERRGELRAEISVTDNGPGIDDAEKTKVMQRFYRGDASRGTPGVGLGLSLVEAIAKLHGGALTLADNRPGLRAQMTIERGATVPTAAPEQPRIDPDRRQPGVEITA